jgi:hypothetical protein
LLGLLYKLKEEPNSISIPLHWRYWFGELETRWVAVFRILFSMLLLKDAIYHIFLARLFYSDDGIVPRGAFFSGMARDYRFSLMDAIASEQGAILFFLVWIVVIILLMLGYRVRLMAILNYILLLSVHERDVFVLTGADTMMRAMAFWLMFAPIGQHYSLDALRRKSQSYPQESSAFALPIRLLQWQLITVYICTSYLKMIGSIWMNGETLNYVLQLDTFILPFGEWMRTWSPELLKVFSFGALFAEMMIPFFLLFPLYWRWSRLLAFLLALGLHGGIALMLAIPDFSIVMLISFVLFFDPMWLVWLERRFANQFERIEGRFASILHYLYPQHWKPVSRRPYHAVMLSLVLVPIFLMLIWWNAHETSNYNDDTYQGIQAPYPYALPYPPEPYIGFVFAGENFLRLIGIWQYWDMFSPLPIQHDGYFVIKGEFEDGTFLDILSGRPLEEGYVNRWYWGPEMRFEKFEENVYAVRNERLMASWGDFFCREYETRPVGQRLARLEMQYHRTNLHSPIDPPNEPFIDTIWYHWCFEEYAPQG